MILVAIVVEECSHIRLFFFRYITIHMAGTFSYFNFFPSLTIYISSQKRKQSPCERGDFVMLSMKADNFLPRRFTIPEEWWSPGAILRWSCLLVQECSQIITTVWSQTWFVSDETKLKRGFGRIITVPQPLSDHWTMSEVVIRTPSNTCSMAIGFSAPAVLLYRSVPVGLHSSLI